VTLEAAHINLDERSKINDFQGNAAIDLFVNNVQGWIQEGIHRRSFTTCSDSNRIGSELKKLERTFSRYKTPNSRLPVLQHAVAKKETTLQGALVNLKRDEQDVENKAYSLHAVRIALAETEAAAQYNMKVDEQLDVFDERAEIVKERMKEARNHLKNQRVSFSNRTHGMMLKPPTATLQITVESDDEEFDSADE